MNKNIELKFSRILNSGTIKDPLKLEKIQTLLAKYILLNSLNYLDDFQIERLNRHVFKDANKLIEHLLFEIPNFAQKLEGLLENFEDKYVRNY